MGTQTKLFRAVEAAFLGHHCRPPRTSILSRVVPVHQAATPPHQVTSRQLGLDWTCGEELQMHEHHRRPVQPSVNQEEQRGAGVGTMSVTMSETKEQTQQTAR